MLSILKRYTLTFIILLIASLLLANIYLIDRNNALIEENKALQEEAEKIKVNTLNIIRTIHFLDMTIRGYALRKDHDYSTDLANVVADRERTYELIEPILLKQKYPIEKFYAMRDSVDAYFDLVAQLKSYLDNNQQDEFLKILKKDRGYRAWLVYKRFSDHINSFENKIAKEAHSRYSATLNNSYILQVILFFIIVPTLAYTAFFTSKSVKLSKRLHEAETHEKQLLEDQNIELEQRVNQRTNEIRWKNDEIIRHNQQLTIQQQQIAAQNATVLEQYRQLEQAKRIIEDQSQEIRKKNSDLEKEVDLQTQSLQQTNLELIEHNNRLEQFTFIISHNLRAPITRLVGLSNILSYARDDDDQKRILQLIVKSTHELDEVIVDLNQILGIQRLTTKVYSRVLLTEVIDKIKSILATELEETHCEVVTHFEDVEALMSLPQYVESIFYNLISNAVKYRHPDRTPVIHINARRSDGKVELEVADNGLGIDVERNKKHLFHLYKRFHFHVEGKGLGLYLVKTQVTALGGKIDLRSTPNEGSIFTIELSN